MALRLAVSGVVSWLALAGLAAATTGLAAGCGDDRNAADERGVARGRADAGDEGDGTIGEAPRADAGPEPAARDAGGRPDDGGARPPVATGQGHTEQPGAAEDPPRDGSDSAAMDASTSDGGRLDASADSGNVASEDAGDAASADDGADAGVDDEPLTYLNAGDAAPGIVVEADGLSAEWRTLATAGVRSTRAIAPGEGVFYYEATIWDAFNGLTIGVATAAAPLGQNAGANDQSFGIDPGGQIYANGSFVAAFPAGGRTFGFVLDYRGAQPTVHTIVSVRGHPAIVRSEPLSAVAEPVFIYLAGIRRTTERHVTIRPGNDTVNAPFAFDPAALLRSAGLADVADALVLGWGASHAGVWNEPPTLLAPSGSTVSAGSQVTLSAAASDAEDGALDAHIGWEVLSTGSGPERVQGTGATFTFTPPVLGTHPVRVTAIDSGGKQARAVVDVRALGTLAQYEHVRIEPDALSGSGVLVADDGLRVRWTAPAKNGIRANQALYGGFWYFEAQRLIAPANQAAGLVIGGVSLDPIPFNVTPPSCSINTGGGVYQNLIFRAPPPAAAVEYYGFAVDYRGRHPIVHIVWDGVLAHTLELVDATVPIHPMLYGNPTGAGAAWDIAVNFGGSPFRYDPVAALTAAGIDASALRTCWGEANSACP